MKRTINLSAGTIKQYNRNTQLDQLIKIIIIAILSCFVFFIMYKLIPNPYLCYDYNTKKITNKPVEFTWTGDSYQCRFAIGNSGILAVRNFILQLYFIDGATVVLNPQIKEWQKNDDINYFWTKNVVIPGGIHRYDCRERAEAINVIFHKKNINRIKYIITSNGLQKSGEIKVINRH